MKQFSPNDDVLISYLIGDLSEEQRAQVENWLEQSEDHRQRLSVLKLLQQEIRSTPLRFQRRTLRQVWWKLSLRLGTIVGILILGMWMQARWGLINQSKEFKENNPTPLSEPLSWDRVGQSGIL